MVITRKAMIFILLLSVGLGLAACGSTDSDGETAVSGDADPERLYRNCINCHGRNMQGGAGPSLVNIGERFTADEIAEIITKGVGRMGPIRQVSEEDAVLLAAWLVDQ